MKPVKKWFSLGPYNEDECRKTHWYNQCYEFSGTRVVHPWGGKVSTPAEHYQAAERLLAIAEDDMASPIFKHRLYLAEVHAMLAQCFQPDDEEAEFYHDGNTYRAPVVETREPRGDRL